MSQNKKRTIDTVFSVLFPDLRIPSRYTALKYGLLAAVLIYIFSYLIIPFSNGDPGFYTTLGRSVLREHILPYQAVFDHKPFGVYLFYGVWDRLFPFCTAKFTVLAFLLSVAFVCLCRTFGSFSRRTAFVLLIVCGAIFNVLAGNSEPVLLTGEALCLALMLKGIQNDRISLFFLAGLVAAFIVNVNYLATVCLLAPVALLLLSSGWFRPSRLCLTMAGGLTGLVVLFAPYFMAGHGALQNYFFMQRDFLHHYSGSLHERLLCLLRNAVDTVLLWPILAAWCRRFPLLDWTQDNRQNLILPLWFLSSLPATVLSGHPFDHYFLLCFAPAVIMWSILLRQGVTFPRYAFVPLFIATTFFLVDNTRRNFNTRVYLNRIDYTGISKEIGQEKVLNIRAYQGLFYLSDLRSFDPYLFHDHIDILYGQQAWKHYMHDLQQNPLYITMPYDGCAQHVIEAPICQWVAAHYRLIYSINVRPSKLSKFSVSLYKIETSDPRGQGPQAVRAQAVRDSTN